MTHRMPRAANERHYFITVAPNAVFAFFEFPDAETPPYAPPTRFKSGRALDNVAFFVEDEAALEAWHARLMGKVDNLTEIRDLDIVRAFFFSDPNGIVLEVMAERSMPFPLYLDPKPVADLPMPLDSGSVP